MPIDVVTSLVAHAPIEYKAQAPSLLTSDRVFWPQARMQKAPAKAGAVYHSTSPAGSGDRFGLRKRQQSSALFIPQMQPCIGKTLADGHPVPFGQNLMIA